MARPPKFPDGVSLYKDRTGSREIYRVRLGARFLGPGVKPVKRAFTAHADAVDWIRSENERLFGKPMEIDGVSADQIADMRVALARLDGQASLVEAANAWLQYVKPFQQCPTVGDVAARVVAAKVSAGVGEEYAAELKGKFDLYLDGYLKKKMSDLSSDDVEAILDRDDKRHSTPSQSAGWPTPIPGCGTTISSMREKPPGWRARSAGQFLGV